jgi:hypothetical protein
VADKRIGYEVRDPEVENLLRMLATSIRGVVPPYMGFALLIFDHGSQSDPGNLFYISDSDRTDMIAAFREFIAKYEFN